MSMRHSREIKELIMAKDKIIAKIKLTLIMI